MKRFSPRIGSKAADWPFWTTRAVWTIGVVAAWSAIASALIAVIVSTVMPMRVSEDAEREGLDITSHGERAWEFD